MADSNKLVSLIVLLVAGLLIAIWGAISIWFKVKDNQVLGQLVADGQISPADKAKVSNPFLVYGLGAVQILIGLGLIIWGIVQYTVKSSILAQAKDTVQDLGRSATRRITALSRRRFNDGPETYDPAD